MKSVEKMQEFGRLGRTLKLPLALPGGCRECPGLRVGLGTGAARSLLVDYAVILGPGKACPQFRIGSFTPGGDAWWARAIDEVRPMPSPDLGRAQLAAPAPSPTLTPKGAFGGAPGKGHGDSGEEPWH